MNLGKDGEKLKIQNTYSLVLIVLALSSSCYSVRKTLNDPSRDFRAAAEEGDLCTKKDTISCLVDNAGAAKLYFDKCVDSPDDKEKDLCPRRDALETLICFENKTNPNAPRYCKNCKLDGAPCGADSECCSSYFSVAPELNFRTIRAGSKCLAGVCTACLPAGFPCSGSRLRCCDEITHPNPQDYRCRRSIWYDSVNPPTYDLCGPSPCLKDLKGTRYRQARCFAGDNVNYPKKYDKVNFCRCPKDMKTGYKCVTGNYCKSDCVECGLDESNCASSDDCCDFHYCDDTTMKCKQMNCTLEGASCALKPCCGKLICLSKYYNKKFVKVCTSDMCKKTGESCIGRPFECCEPARCFSIKGKPPVCAVAPKAPASTRFKELVVNINSETRDYVSSVFVD